jgi:transposase-like protein
MARQSYSKEFKARVALDTLKGQKTVSEVVSEHRVHPNLVAQWKKKALAGECAPPGESKLCHYCPPSALYGHPMYNRLLEKKMAPSLKAPLLICILSFR